MKISLKGNTTDGETRRVDQLEDRVFLDPVDTLVEVLQPIIIKHFLFEIFAVFFQPQFPKVLEFFCQHWHVHQKLVPQSRLCKCIWNVSQISSRKSSQASFSHLMFIIPTYFGMIPLPPVENVFPVIEDVPRNEPLLLWNRLFCPQCVLHIVGVNTLVVGPSRIHFGQHNLFL